MLGDQRAMFVTSSPASTRQRPVDQYAYRRRADPRAVDLSHPRPVRGEQRHAVRPRLDDLPAEARSRADHPLMARSTVLMGVPTSTRGFSRFPAPMLNHPPGLSGVV